MILTPLRPLARPLLRAAWRTFGPYDDPQGDSYARRSIVGTSSAPNRWDAAGYGGHEDVRMSGTALPQRKLLALAGLALAALLVAIGTIAIEAQLASRPSSSRPISGATVGPGTPTATALATNTPPAAATPVDLATLGWVKRTLTWAERVASAPSAPNTVYACGGVAGQNDWTVNFAVSQDGGHTWAFPKTTLQAAHCYDIAVSPTAPQAVAIHMDTCPSDCGQGQQLVSYTLDAGNHWSAISSPCICAPSPDDGAPSAWVGTTLFAIPGSTNPARADNQYLAKSTNGGAFTWLNLSVPPQQLLSTGNTVYAVNGTDLYKSTDLGASWAKSSLSAGGNPVAALAMAPGAPLVGIDGRWLNPSPNTYPLLRSTDGGATWQALPALPAAMQINAGVLETPDGTIYLMAITPDGSQGGIYKLSPGATQWKVFSSVTAGNLRLMAVTWDTNGHPAAVWGLSQAHPNTSDPGTVLWSHAP